MFDPKQLASFPTSPGVYLMKNQAGKILYVGKAKNLKNRLKQYFGVSKDTRAIIPTLTSQVSEIDTIIVGSEKEALLLENNLIKKHQPKYNAALKDDKTFFSLAINHHHQWPMIRVVRYKGTPPSDQLYFGPYTQGYAARQTLELLRHLFPLRQCSDRELASRTRPCILYELKRCIAPCVGKCTKEEYDVLVGQVINFLQGHDQIILKELKNEMELAIKNLEFEKAEQIHHTIQYIEVTLEKQKVEKAGAADMDVLGIYRQADTVVLTQMLYREGKLIASYDRRFSNNAQNDGELISSFIVQNYADNSLLPKEILVPIELEDSAALTKIITADKNTKCSIITPKKGNKRELIDMAIKNAEARFKREEEQKNDKERVLIAMEEKLQLINYPETIECFDNSNISGTEPVSVMVVFEQGRRDPKRYRQFKIKQAGASDDYGALKEVLVRRYTRAKEEDNLPDLILIDGGKGHLNLARQTLSALDVSTVDVISIAKEEGKHTRSLTAERIFIPAQPDPLILHPHDPILFFLQQIRDEAHRFAITFHRKRRAKRTLASALDEIPGIGPTKKKRLLQRFGSLKRILDADEEEWRQVKGITVRDLETLKQLKEKNHTTSF